MTLGIFPYSPDDIAAIEQFNARLRAVGSEYSFPRRPDDLMPQGPDVGPIRHELFIAKDADIVRGGYALKREQLLLETTAEQLCNLQIPLSEALIDKSYSNIGAAMVFDAARRARLIYCLGMGSAQRPLPQLLAKLRWRIEHVPFRFRVLRATGFLREIRFLRARRAVALLADLARFTGVGPFAVWLWNSMASVRAPVPSDLSIELVTQFDTQVDTLQAQLRDHYPLMCDRSAAALNQKFPAGDTRLNKLLVSRSGPVVGWLVVTCTQLRGHKQFGNMRLGCIADGLCAHDDAPAMIALAVSWLRNRGVDLVVSNQSHHAWLSALRRNLFIDGPTNFVLAMSPELAKRAPPLEQCHFNRGDGDGPINL